jgi:phosphoserine aminotransferase
LPQPPDSIPKHGTDEDSNFWRDAVTDFVDHGSGMDIDVVTVSTQKVRWFLAGNHGPIGIVFVAERIVSRQTGIARATTKGIFKNHPIALGHV